MVELGAVLMALNWRGSQVTRSVERAARLGVDATMQAAAIEAKKNHGPGAHSLRRFESQTGELERSVRITDKAKRDAKGIVGRWGSKGIIYARRIELGFQGPDALGRVFDQPEFPFLRPAAEKEYPNLAGRIRRALGRGRRA